MSTQEAFKGSACRFLGPFPLISPCVFERRKWTGRDWSQHHHRQCEDLNVLHGRSSSSLWGGGFGLILHLYRWSVRGHTDIKHLLSAFEGRRQVLTASVFTCPSAASPKVNEVMSPHQPTLKADDPEHTIDHMTTMSRQLSLSNPKSNPAKPNITV